MPEDEENFEPFAILNKFIELRLEATTGDNYKGIGKRNDARLAHNDYYNLESRQENSLKYLPIWSEAFVITSLVWTFAAVLDKKARKQLADAMKTRILGAKSDFGTYQKLKKKAVATTALAEANVTKPTKKLTDNTLTLQKQSSVQDEKMLTHFGKKQKLIRQLTRRLSVDGF